MVLWRCGWNMLCLAPKISSSVSWAHKVIGRWDSAKQSFERRDKIGPWGSLFSAIASPLWIALSMFYAVWRMHIHVEAAKNWGSDHSTDGSDRAKVLNCFLRGGELKNDWQIEIGFQCLYVWICELMMSAIPASWWWWWWWWWWWLWGGCCCCCCCCRCCCRCGLQGVVRLIEAAGKAKSSLISATRPSILDAITNAEVQSGTPVPKWRITL